MLPDIEQTSRPVRPQTSESSATTVPPTYMHSSKVNCDTCRDIPPLLVPPSQPATHEDLSSHKDSPDKAAASVQVPTVGSLPKEHKNPAKENSLHGGELRAEHSQPKTEKRKKRAPPEAKKTKRPRLGPSQQKLKKNGKPKARKNQTAAKQASGSSEEQVRNTLLKENENAGQTEMQLGHCAITEANSDKKASKDAVNSQTKAIRPRDLKQMSGQQVDNSTKPLPGFKKREIKQNEEKDISKQHDVCKESEEAKVPLKRGDQPMSREPDGNRKVAGNAAVVSNCGATQLESRHTGEAASGKVKTGKRDCTNKNDLENATETSLEKKYEDLSRRYIGLVTRLLKPSSSRNTQDSSEHTGEAGCDRAKIRVIDQKLYNTIYLCKVAGMLGTMKIEGEPCKDVGPPGSDRYENPYNRIIMDGFELVEDLMTTGEPEGNCSSNVTTVFCDLHMRVLMELWERKRNQEGGMILVGQVLKVISDQVKQWYLKIMYGKIGIRWSSLISEKLTEPLYKKLKERNENLATEFATTIQEVLKEISKQYQEAEKDVSKASLEIFCNSCEVSICVARSVPEAALSLGEEDAYAIGRHNGVFSHCVARLQAEQDAEAGAIEEHITKVIEELMKRTTPAAGGD